MMILWSFSTSRSKDIGVSRRSRGRRDMEPSGHPQGLVPKCSYVAFGF